MGFQDSIDRVSAERDALVRAALDHVPFDGWTPAALKAAAEDIGLKRDDVARVLPGGVREAVAVSVDLADRDMLDALAEMDLAEMKIRQRIHTAIRTRLEQAAPHREVVRASVSMLSMPYNAALSLKLTATTVDVIWRACGDRSTDYNWYTKRAMLAGVYGSTLLYWLDDTSEDFAETWAFLDRRIENVMQVPKVKARVEKLGDFIPNPFRFGRKLVNATNR